MDPERWQHKYRETVAELDRQEQQWRETEERLRRLVTRLCIAARGQHPRLDRQLDALAAWLRQPQTGAGLEQLLGELTQAVTLLDRPAPAAATPPLPGACGDRSSIAALKAALSELLARIQPDESARDRVESLRQRLPQIDDAAALAAAAVEAADCAQLEALALRQGRDRLDRLLQQLSTRLLEITDFFKGEQIRQDEAQADGRSLDRTLLGETRALYSDVRQAADLGALQHQVGERLSTIERHLREYRAREQRRAAAQRERAEALRARVEELENRTRVLTRELQKTERRADSDALTGVANRAAYDRRIGAELKLWRRDGRPRSLALIDVDHFKAINDRYGHQAGDKVLQVLATHLSHRLRDCDFIARYGGEEFVVLMSDLTASDALGVADKLRQSVTELAFHFRRLPVTVTVSAGIAGLHRGDSAQSWLERADRALYQAKHNGRNRCVAG